MEDLTKKTAEWLLSEANDLQDQCNYFRWKATNKPWSDNPAMVERYRNIANDRARQYDSIQQELKNRVS